MIVKISIVNPIYFDMLVTSDIVVASFCYRRRQRSNEGTILFLLHLCETIRKKDVPLDDGYKLIIASMAGMDRAY
jgi:hypothetical protein